MDKQRRTLFFNTTAISALAYWRRPVVNAVILPSHAQTSVCMASDIVGIWDYVDEDTVSISYEYFEDGTAIVVGSPESTATWQLLGSTLNLVRPSGTEAVQRIGDILLPCDSYTGERLLGNVPFTATKRK